MEGVGLRARVLEMVSSPWARVVARAVFFGLVLGVLAAIGHVANANADAKASASAGAEVNANANANANESGASRAAVATQNANANADAGTGTSTGAGDEPGKVRLNVADETELRRLPGLGPKRAAQVLALRARMGRFQRVEDLLRVKGVGRATLKKWRPLVTLEGPPARGDGGVP